MLNGDIDVLELTGDITNVLSLEGNLLPIGPKGDKGDPGFSPVVTTSKSGKTTTVKFETATGNVYAYIQDGEDGQGSGDMMTDVYDQNKNGIVDNAEKVNNHTVEKDVPANADFSDTKAIWGNITGTLANQTDLNTALGTKANTSDLSTVATSGSYNDLSNKPTNVSTFTNDANYITSNGNAESTQTNVSSATFTNTLEAPMNIDLKGNTLQNGTPTPSSPIPINNVSGDNDIVVCGKNICPTDFNDWQSGQYNQNTGEKETHTSRICVKNLIPITPNTNYYFDNFSSNDNFIVREYDNSKDFIKNIGGVVNNSVITTSNNGAYISITLYSNTNQTRNYEIYKTMFANGNIKPFICLASTTDKTYEAYNGTTYPINLGELKGRGTIYNYSFNASSFTSGGNRTLCIPIEANTTYYITKSMVSNRFRICLSNAVPSSSSVSVNEYSDVSTLTSTSITNTNYKYLNIFYWTYNDTYTEEQIYDSLSVYTTTPIELNKIGTYQDYIYKENDKWYLHKEIGKVVLNGSENFAVNKNQTYVLQFTLLNFVNALNVYSGILLCDNFKYKTGDPTSTTNEDYMWIFQNILVVDIRKEIAPDLNSFKTWLSTHNTSVYYQLKDATNTLITYTPLIEQLESIKNAMSKEGTTNVNQVNNDAPFMLDLSVFNDTYNGRYQSVLEMYKRLKEAE